MWYQPNRGDQLYTPTGERKYLNTEERMRFIAAAENEPMLVRSFCLTLAHTGCRISEGLAVKPNHVQLLSGILSFRTLKQRKRKKDKMVVRELPIPRELQDALRDVLSIAAASSENSDRLWPWSRTTGWSHVKRVMDKAGIAGAHASPKGLRHGFAIHALSSLVPLNLIQRWLGHASITTTMIYLEVIGPEERAYANRMWSANALHDACDNQVS